MNAPVRQRWLNFILHLSSFIYTERERLLTSHVLPAILIILRILLAEFFLALLSLPLYLVSTPTKKGDQGTVQFRLRRALTLSVLSVICVIWLVKLALILALSYSQGQSSDQFRYTQATHSLTARETQLAFTAPIDPHLQIPTIQARPEKQSQLLLQGTARAQSRVVISLIRTQSASHAPDVTLYTTEADAQGAWTLQEQGRFFRLLPGTYQASAFAFEAEKDAKSQLSPSTSFTIHPAVSRSILLRLDLWLNTLIALVLLIAGGLILLLG